MPEPGNIGLRPCGVVCSSNLPFSDDRHLCTSLLSTNSETCTAGVLWLSWNIHTELYFDRHRVSLAGCWIISVKIYCTLSYKKWRALLLWEIARQKWWQLWMGLGHMRRKLSATLLRPPHLTFCLQYTMQHCCLLTCVPPPHIHVKGEWWRISQALLSFGLC